MLSAKLEAYGVNELLFEPEAFLHTQQHPSATFPTALKAFFWSHRWNVDIWEFEAYRCGKVKFYVLHAETGIVENKIKTNVPLSVYLAFQN